VTAEATFADAAGNASAPVTGSQSYAVDIAAPDTSGTTVTVGVIAGDGVLNNTEAGANVPVTVTLGNVPADATTT
ncbi:hypothetical protein, partial [Comamonas sp. NoAH]|uniref:hypothetical protein n=1 Tax=Comamonas halotolerans TaxID=3041496 RepID=UPI0024E0717A